jgi:hypothetical protein
MVSRIWLTPELHELGLQVGGEARERIGFDVDRLDAVAIAAHAQAVGFRG